MRQRLTFNAVLCALLLVFAANPASQAGEFSIGASAVRAAVNVKEAGTDISGDSSGYRVFGTYMFNRHFGIEGGVSSIDAPDDTRIPANMQVETEGYDLYAVAAYPMGEKLGFVAKAGFASWNTETEIDDTDESNFRSTDLALSLGGQYDISERFSIRGEYNWFDAATSGAEDALTLGAVFRFK